MFKNIFIIIFSVALLAPLAVWAQEGSISGQITDEETGESLPGASVLLEGTQFGVSTDMDGMYTLANIPEGEYTLNVTYIGYADFSTTVQLAEGQDLTVDVAMEPDFLGLEELVVVGYGTRERRDITGSVSSVSGLDVETLPVSNVESALAGRSSGVQVTSSSGLPGGEVTIRIRGASSVGAGNQPLYVVDGVPITTGTTSFSLAGNAGEHTTSALADINPADIESMEILKDAAATAIYGSRAANGVVLITTRRGMAAATEFTVSHYTAFVTETNRFDMMDGPGFVEVAREAGVPGSDGYPDPADAQTYNWVDAVHQQGINQNYDVSVRGGDERTRFFITGTYFDQEGYLIENRFRRMSGRLNLDHSITDRFQVGLNFQFTRGMNDRVGSDNLVMGLITSSALQTPINPIFLEDGSYNFGNVPGNIAFNTVFEAEQNRRELRTFRSIGNVFGEIEILPGLDFRTSWGLDLLDADDFRRYLAGHGSGGLVGSGSRRNEGTINWVGTNTLNYRTVFNDIHRLTVLGGIEFQHLRREGVFAAASNFPSDLFPNITSATEPTSTTAYTSQDWGLMSYFTRATYSFDNRYIFEGSARVDGSSRFSEANRFGFFPAGSVAWRITEEGFMRDNRNFDELKLRFSAGLVGNDNIGDFAARPLWAGGANYGGIPGLAPDQLESPELRWESTLQFDLGLDMALLNERLGLTFDIYQKNTTDMILPAQLPLTTGFTAVTRNVGEMMNQGIELGMNTFNLTGALRWTTDFNISFNRNEVTALVDDEPILGIDNQRAEVGHPLGVFFLPEWAGVDPETGMPQWLDAEGNPTSDYAAAERRHVGDAQPAFFGGLSNTFSYGGFDLSTLFQFVYGNDIYWSSGHFLYNSSTAFNVSRDLENRWREAGDETDIPAAQFGSLGTLPSTRFLEDGSFLRLKDVTLSYMLPGRFVDNLGFQRARVYLQGFNLLTITNYRGLDPEVSNQGTSTLGQGTDFFTPPQPRTFQVGVDFSF